MADRKGGRIKDRLQAFVPLLRFCVTRRTSFEYRMVEFQPLEVCSITMRGVGFLGVLHLCGSFHSS